MNVDEAQARALVLMRAVESAPTPLWSAADGDWAGREAQRSEGESATPQRFLVRRSRCVCQRLAERGVALAREPVRHSAGFAALVWLLPLGAFGLGWGADALSTAPRINILAPPLLALLLWNLGVYGLLAAQASVHAFRLWRPRRRDPGLPVRGTESAGAGWVRAGVLAALLAWQRKAEALVGQGSGPPPLPGEQALAARFRVDWVRCARPWLMARATACVHLAAAALALGALASFYARGLAFEYRAVWESTFLTPAAAQRLVSFVLGPASAFSGIALPDVAQMRLLRAPASAGENAAGWIHLYALTLGAAVVVPRLMLAGWAAWRARRWRAAVPVPWDDACFQRLHRSRSGRPLDVQVLPYSYRVADALLPGLRRALDTHWGAHPGSTRLHLAAPVPMSGEDDLARWLPDLPTPTAVDAGAATPLARVALFALTATPERETHGAFAQALALMSKGASPGAFAVMVDESGFRARFVGDETRRQQRRQAWQALLHDLGLQAVFVDLSAPSDAPLSQSTAAQASVPR